MAKSSIYIIVVKEPTSYDYMFKHFDEEEDVITYVSNMSKGPNKVHKILRLNYTGNTEEYTINFNDGKLGLYKKFTPVSPFEDDKLEM